MPEMASLLLRRSIGALATGRSKCSSCERSPLPGERLHELDGGPLLCDLCFAALPAESRVAVRTERVSMSERRLAVVPKAA